MYIQRRKISLRKEKEKKRLGRHFNVDVPSRRSAQLRAPIG